MRRLLLGSAIVLAFGTLATPGRAQDAFGDPFFLYYGFFLPRQQALANQPGPEVGIQAMQSNRAALAIADRAGLYQPIPELGADELRSGTPFAGRSLNSRRAPTSAGGPPTSHIRGSGPAGYFNRTSRYFPGTRSGRGVTQAPVGGGMGYSTTSMSSLVPNPQTMMNVPGAGFR